MPKKLATNPKALEARTRQEEKKRSEEERKQREAEDALWHDDDKDLAKKQKRKEEQEKKKQEAAERKATAKAALEEEMNSLKGRGSASVVKKVTRSDIKSLEEKQLKERESRENEKKKISVTTDLPLENINRVVIDGDEARSVEEAISILSVKDGEEGDRHPERRMKAAYLSFEEKRLPQIKAENPNMRLSQWKQILKKEWLKSPENPLNQSTIAYNKPK